MNPFETWWTENVPFPFANNAQLKELARKLWNHALDSVTKYTQPAAGIDYNQEFVSRGIEFLKVQQ